MSFSKKLLPEFDEEMKNTRKLLECVPDDKFDFQPHAKSMKLGRLATHVAEILSWTVFTIDQDVFEMQPGHQPNLAKSRAELLETFDKGVADARQRIQSTNDAHWQKDWTFKYAGKQIMSNPRSTIMRSVIMNHLVHHRAQLGVFLRLNNVAIPGMYGPSADEPNMFG